MSVTTNPVINGPNDDGSGGSSGGSGSFGYLGKVATTADLPTTFPDASIGSTANVGASASAYIRYELYQLPATVEANWQPVQGVLTSGTAVTMVLVTGKVPRTLLVVVPTGNQVTYFISGVTQYVLTESPQPHIIRIYDMPGETQPSSVSVQRTSGSDATGTFSLEDY